MSAPVTEQAAALTVEATSRALHLPTVRQQAAALAEAALRERLSHLAYLAEVLSNPNSTTARRAAVNAASTRRASPGSSTSPTSTWRRRPPSTRPCSPRWSAASGSPQGEPVVLLGDSGTGKSHLLIGLGMAACQRGLRVRYTTAAQLVNELAEAADERMLSRVVARYGRLDLLL